MIVAQDEAEQRPQTITLIELDPYAVTRVRAPRPGPGGPVAFDGGTLTLRRRTVPAAPTTAW